MRELIALKRIHEPSFNYHYQLPVHNGPAGLLDGLRQHLRVIVLRVTSGCCWAGNWRRGQWRRCSRCHGKLLHCYLWACSIPHPTIESRGDLWT